MGNLGREKREKGTGKGVKIEGEKWEKMEVEKKMKMEGEKRGEKREIRKREKGRGDGCRLEVGAADRRAGFPALVLIHVLLRLPGT